VAQADLFLQIPAYMPSRGAQISEAVPEASCPEATLEMPVSSDDGHRCNKCTRTQEWTLAGDQDCIRRPTCHPPCGLQSLHSPKAVSPSSCSSASLSPRPPPGSPASSFSRGSFSPLRLRSERSGVHDGSAIGLTEHATDTGHICGAVAISSGGSRLTVPLMVPACEEVRGPCNYWQMHPCSGTTGPFSKPLPTKIEKLMVIYHGRMLVWAGQYKLLQS
jgi:hypothetical protein